MKRRTGLTAILAFAVLAAFSALVFQAQANEPESFAEARLGKGFVSATATVNGATLHYVRGGKGPPLVLVHGFPQDWFEYGAIMPRLAKRFTVIAVDLRGIGGSKVTSGGYDTDRMADDIRQLVAALGLGRVFIVGHDIGGQVTYAFVRRYAQGARAAMILDSPIPGIAGWSDVQGDPKLWHAHFMEVPDLPEKLVTGRQAAFLGYFFGFGNFKPREVAHYLEAYSTPAQLHAVFEMYRASPANARVNAAQRGRNDVPLFLGAGDRSPFARLLPKMAEDLRARGFSRVATGLIRGSVHYVVEDQPDAVARLIERFASALRD
jgi:pimeloyl-ACP methyl ester carboxylesterase